MVRREYFIANEYEKIRNRLALERILLGINKTVFSINSLTWFEWQNQESSCNILSGSRFHCVKLAYELKSADGSANTFHQLSEIFQKLPKLTTILLEKSLMTMLYSNIKNKESKIWLPFKFVSLQQHLLWVNRIIHLNRLLETNVNVTNIIKMTTKWFSKGTFYNKTLNKDKYHKYHSLCFLFCNSKIEFPPLYYYLHRKLEKLSIFLNTLFL